jgi:hypothetical protein
MSIENNDILKKRLVYVKKLYMHGHEHIPNQTEFDRMIALHHFDNAIELVLKCVAAKFDIKYKSNSVSFPDLWNVVNEKILLPKKTEIFQLHDLRSDVQHWGVSPFSSEVVDRFDVYVHDFMKEVLNSAFGISFEELFMSSLIRNKMLRELLSASETAFEKKDYLECMKYADAALGEAFSLKRQEFRLRADLDDSDLITRLADVVSIIALGIDYIEYEKYRDISTGAYYVESCKEVILPGKPLREMFGGDEPIANPKVHNRKNAFFSLNFTLNCLFKWHF